MFAFVPIVGTLAVKGLILPTAAANRARVPASPLRPATPAMVLAHNRVAPRLTREPSAEMRRGWHG